MTDKTILIIGTFDTKNDELDFIAGKIRARCSGVPKAKSVGASKQMPFWVTRLGAPAR